MSHSFCIFHVPKYMKISWQGETLKFFFFLIIEAEIFAISGLKQDILEIRDTESENVCNWHMPWAQTEDVIKTKRLELILIIYKFEWIWLVIQDVCF